MTAQELKNSILQLAIQGKLVKQDPNDEPASVLLEKIKEEREKLIKEKKIKREKYSEIYKDPSDNHYYEKFEDGTIKDITEEIPFEIPETWEICRLDLLAFLDNGIKVKSKKLPYLEAKYLRGKSSPTYLDCGIEVFPNDFLILVDGENSGEVFINKENGYMGSTFKILNISKNMNYEYVLFILKYFQNYLKNSKKGAAIPHLNKELFKNLLITIPPLIEQSRIVARIKEIKSLIQKYDYTYNKLNALNISYKDELKKSILQYAIQGKLIKQNLNDEPADRLIEKILNEKRELIKAKKIKKENLSAIYKDTDNQFYEKFDDGKIVNITDEIPFDIPENWCWTRMKNICLINPRNSLDDKLEVSFIPMTLIEGGYKNSHTFEIKKWKEIKSGFTHFRENDIGLAKITPCFQNRKSTIFSNLKNGYGAGTTELHILRPIIKDVLKEYIFWLIKSSYFIDTGIKTYNGTAGQQRIHKDFLPNFLVPIPNTNEQKRIVFKIKEIFDYIKTAE